jgi:hypothetical protein
MVTPGWLGWGGGGGAGGPECPLVLLSLQLSRQQAQLLAPPGPPLPKLGVGAPETRPRPGSQPSSFWSSLLGTPPRPPIGHVADLEGGRESPPLGGVPTSAHLLTSVCTPAPQPDVHVPHKLLLGDDDPPTPGTQGAGGRFLLCLEPFPSLAHSCLFSNQQK